VTVNIEAMRELARPASLLLKAMGNQDRLLVLCYLSEGEKSARDLADLINVSQSSISQHLNRLERDNLVTRRRVDHRLYFTLAGKDAPVIIEALQRIFAT
jgi:DNA-binding transcriptional ArsR family regulator